MQALGKSSSNAQSLGTEPKPNKYGKGRWIRSYPWWCWQRSPEQPSKTGPGPSFLLGGKKSECFHWLSRFAWPPAAKHLHVQGHLHTAGGSNSSSCSLSDLLLLDCIVLHTGTYRKARNENTHLPYCHFLFFYLSCFLASLLYHFFFKYRITIAGVNRQENTDVGKSLSSCWPKTKHPWGGRLKS